MAFKTNSLGRFVKNDKLKIANNKKSGVSKLDCGSCPKP